MTSLLAPQKASDTGPLRILVVDDDQMLCDLLTSKLTKEGYVVDAVTYAEDGLALIADNDYEVILADIFIGEDDGLELLAQSRKLRPDTPVILMTGAPSVETATSAVHLNAYSYLSKPVSMQHLVNTVTRAVELRQLRAEKKRIEAENRNYQHNLEKLVQARTSKLIQSNQRYHLLFEHSKDAIYMATRKGRFLSLNRAAVELFGRSHDELMKIHVRDLYADPERRTVFQRQIEAEGYVKDFEIEFSRKDGSIMECLLTAHLITDDKGQTTGYQGIIRDITAQKQAERKIKAQNRFLTDVIESLSHPFMVIDAADYKVRIANAAARRARLADGATCHELNHGLDRPCSLAGHRCALEEVVKTRLPVHLEHRHIDAGGGTGDHEVHAFPLFDAAGRVTQVIQYCVDISDKKRLESIAEAANLMDNLGYIFSGIRHEIGNPLNSVKMALSVLSVNMAQYPREKIREFVDRAMTELSRVEYLLKALKNFSMHESPQTEPVQLDAFIRHFTALVESDFKSKGIAIDLDLPDQTLKVQIDPRAFHQVLLNLVTNAADALDGRKSPRITISACKKADWIQLAVADNGIGISKANRKNLFHPFYTSKPNGTGLGLVIVKKMLAKMNSTIRIESQHLIGTTITMSLPEGKP